MKIDISLLIKIKSTTTLSMHYVVPNLVKYHPSFLSDSKADSLFVDLLSYQTAAEKAGGVMYGKRWESERRSIQIADPGVRTYRYTGSSTTKPLRFEEVECVKKMRDRLRMSLGTHYNFCLVNYYPVVFDEDGNIDANRTASLGWHSDDETDMVAGHPIASVSLGDTRRFRVRNRHTNDIEWDQPLEHGSLVIMEGQCQTLTQHCIWPMTKKDMDDVLFGIRVNLTFRVMKNSK